MLFYKEISLLNTLCLVISKYYFFFLIINILDNLKY